MSDAFTIVSASPDKRHQARLLFSGEVRFGPAYNVLDIDGHTLAHRIFGSVLVWSASSQLLAVQEWLTLDYSEGPITALVVFDLQQGQETTLARETKCFLVPEAFEGATLVYREERADKALSKRFDLNAQEASDWVRYG